MSEVENETLEILIAKYKSAKIEVEKLNSDEINNIAIQIVKDIKNVIENIVLDDNTGKSLKFLSESYKNLALSSGGNSYSLNLFDEPNLFYKKLQNYTNTNICLLIDKEYNVKKVKENLNNSFSIINFSILTDLLIDILELDKNAFKENIIKADIKILAETLTSKVKRITNSNTLFLCFVNELKKKFQITKKEEDSEFIKKANELFKISATKKLSEIKSGIFEHIKGIANQIKLQYQIEIQTELSNAEKTNEYSSIERILNEKKKITKFYNEIKDNEELYKKNLAKLKNKYIESNISSCFEYYAKFLINKAQEYESCTEKYILENILLPFRINEINLNDDEEVKIVYNIPLFLNIEPKDKYYNTFLGRYLEIKEELKFVKGRNYEKEINELINDDTFIQEFFSIISNKTISSYFQAKIKFCNDNIIKFVEDGDFDIFLKNQYQEFVKDMSKDYNKFRNLIIIKQICYKIPAMTNSTMRVCINPIYKISESIQKDPIQLKSILKSALLILLIHELAQFLKAYSTENILKENYPLTPRQKESGKYIIFYLFNNSVIRNITYYQSTLINKVSTWDDLDSLRTIFKKEKATSKGQDSELDFYLAEIDEDIDLETKTEYCLW